MKKIGVISGIIVTLFSFTILANDERVVSQPELAKRLGCGTVVGKSICFKKAVRYSSPEAYLFEFKVNMDLDDSKVIEAIDLSMEQVSAMLNPMTSKYFRLDSSFVDSINQDEYSADEIIISFKTYNREKVYSSYFLPLTTDDETALYSGTYAGDIDLYDLLKNRCDEKLSKDVPYQHDGKTCLLKSSKN